MGVSKIMTTADGVAFTLNMPKFLTKNHQYSCKLFRFMKNAIQFVDGKEGGWQMPKTNYKGG